MKYLNAICTELITMVWYSDVPIYTCLNCLQCLYMEKEINKYILFCVYYKRKSTRLTNWQEKSTQIYKRKSTRLTNWREKSTRLFFWVDSLKCQHETLKEAYLPIFCVDISHGLGPQLGMLWGTVEESR